MEFDFGVVGAAYALLHATHGIADYWLQTDWQAQNKTKSCEALTAHILSYSFAFFVPGVFLYFFGGITPSKVVLLPVVVGLPHAWMDRRKFLGWFLRTTKGWKPEDMPTLSAPVVAVRTHVAIHMDQKFHYLCLALTALWLGAN